MKRFFLAFFLVGLVSVPLFSQAQSKSNANYKPKYLRFGDIPPFSIDAAQGGKFTNVNLKKGAPTMIMIFSVDCSHCQYQTRQITKNIKKFKGVQLVMVTPFKWKKMHAYYRGYGINKYPNIITMGTDSTRALGYFYHLKYYPGIYLYNKKGRIVFHHQGTVPIDTIIHYLKPEAH